LQQPKLGEHARSHEVGDSLSLATCDVEHVNRKRFPAALAHGVVYRDRRLPIRPSRNRARALADSAWDSPPLFDRLSALEPELVRRHTKARVLSQQRDESLNVIGFKRGDVVHKELFVISLGRAIVEGTHRASCTGERGVQRGGRRREQLGTLTFRPCEHIPTDEHDTLAWREHLERRDEREPHRIRKGYLL